MEFLASHPDIDLVIQNGRMLPPEDDPAGEEEPWIRPEVAVTLAARPIGVAEVFRWNLGQLQGMCFRRRALEAVGPLDGSFTILDDLDLVLRVTTAFRAVFLDVPAFVYRRHARRHRAQPRRACARSRSGSPRSSWASIPRCSTCSAAAPSASARRGAGPGWRRERARDGDAVAARTALGRARRLDPANLRYRLRALWLRLRARRVMRIAFMHRQLTGGGTEADLRRHGRQASPPAATTCTSSARAPREAPPGVAVRRVRIVRGGRLVRLLSFAVAAPRAVAREPWDVVVGFGRTPRQDVVRVGGGTHR